MIAWDGDDSVVFFFCLLFLGVVIAVFLSIEEMIQSYHYNTSGHGETLRYDRLRQMGSIIFQKGFNSGACLRVASWDFIEGFFCSSKFSSFIPGMLPFWSMEPT